MRPPKHLRDVATTLGCTFKDAMNKLSNLRQVARAQGINIAYDPYRYHWVAGRWTGTEAQYMRTTFSVERLCDYISDPNSLITDFK